MPRQHMQQHRFVRAIVRATITVSNPLGKHACNIPCIPLAPFLRPGRSQQLEVPSDIRGAAALGTEGGREGGHGRSGRDSAVPGGNSL